MISSDRHLRHGWCSLAVFVLLGLLLETLHGFKVGWYLDAGSEMRRLMFTLAHAHGTLLALVNIAAGLTLRSGKGFEISGGVSHALRWGAVILPAGFFLGGLIIHDGDPGLGILLVPVGALLVLYGVVGVAKGIGKVMPAR